MHKYRLISHSVKLERAHLYSLHHMRLLSGKIRQVTKHILDLEEYQMHRTPSENQTNYLQVIGLYI